MGARDWNFGCGDRSVLASARLEWRAQCFECASGDQRWRRTRVGDAAEYLGRGVAGGGGGGRRGRPPLGGGGGGGAPRGPAGCAGVLVCARLLLSFFSLPVFSF